MATEKEILLNNEIGANKFVRRILLAYCGVNILLWVLCVCGIIASNEKIATITILSCTALVLIATIITRYVKHEKIWAKYLLGITYIFSAGICAMHVQVHAWPFMGLAMVMSIRYFNPTFTIAEGLVTLTVFISCFFYTGELSIISITFFVLLTFVSVCMAFHGKKTMIKQHKSAQEMIALKDKLNDDRLSILSSQIQPHFINNSLNTICYLCEDNPEEASKAAADLASYLRVNMNILKEDQDISFAQEINHIKTYVDLEKRRFGDKLNVKYNIDSDNFLIPPLSIQPLVENAIKHGVCDRINGGHITISSSEGKSSYKVVVEDDGVGFDVYILDRNENKGIGIDSVKTRLRSRCGGTMDIASEPGVGTKVTITIPKEK